MSYKSPIDIILGEMQTEIEDNSFKAVQEYGIFVDKDEMIKALKYDRGQYEHGFTDGYFAAKAKIVRCKDCAYWDGMGTTGRCESPRNGLIYDYTDGLDFCSYGERKEQK